MFYKFVFDGKSSDMFGFLCVSFNENNLDDYSAGSQTEFVTEGNYDGSKWYSISNKYNEPLSYTIQIVKNPCVGEFLTKDETRAILKWLVSPTDYKPFKINHEFFYGENFRVKFTNPKYKVVGNLVRGLELTLNFDRPFSLSDDVTSKWSINNFGTAILYNNSDELDKSLYPKNVTIKVTNNGNIALHNERENVHISTEFKNCIVGEIIKMNCEERIIQSSNTSTPVMERFNKNWIRLSEGENKITITGNCEITFIYNEIRRVGVW